MSPAPRSRRAATTTTIPLVEDEVRIKKQLVSKGGVRVETVTDTVEEFVRETLDAEETDVRRVELNQDITAAPSVRVEDGVTIIPIVEEILVVQKQLRLTAELHIRKRVVSREVEVPVSLRKQRAVVSRLPIDPTTKRSD
jgi:stress response protein YsnF